MNEPRLRRLTTRELTPAEFAAIRALLEAAFDSGDPQERFDDDDWQHALGGVHVVLDLDGAILGHASVVERELHVGGRPLRTGYVEAVAVAPASQRQGVGTILMREVNGEIERGFELGGLGTGANHFYQRLGWRTWRGPSSVRFPDGGERRTPEDDGYLLVLQTPTTPSAPLDLDAPISCEWRPGDVW